MELNSDIKLVADTLRTFRPQSLENMTYMRFPANSQSAASEKAKGIDERLANTNINHQARINTDQH